jgi:hypothetical protein
MTLREQLGYELDAMTESDLQQVASYVSFLKGQSGKAAQSLTDEENLRALYAEFAEEDRALADAGMGDYSDGLMREDQL